MINYSINDLKNALKQLCLQCKTKPSNCNKKQCKRYNIFKELVEKEIKEINSYGNMDTQSR